MPQSFSPAVDCVVQDGFAWITLQNPPVNALGRDLRQQLHASLVYAAKAANIRAVILLGSGRGFSAGGERREIRGGAALAAPRLTRDLHPLIEAMPKPVIGAAHGYALGGGLETLLVCHGRIACADTLIGLPEILNGILPLSATQRLPRLIDMTGCIDLVLTGSKRVASDPGLLRIFDELVAAGDVGALRARAIVLAEQMLAAGPPFPLVRDLSIADPSAEGVLQNLEAAAPRIADEWLWHAALRALRAAQRANSFKEGMAEATTICAQALERVSATRFGYPAVS